MTVENTTANRLYPLPHGTNNLEVDVLRLSATFTMVDIDVATLFAAVATKANSVHGHTMAEIAGLETALAGKMDGGAEFTLNSLTDVNTTGAANGQFLRLVGGAWVPATINLDVLPLTGGNLSGFIGATAFRLDANAQWALEGGNPTMRLDAGDYEDFNRAANAKNLTIGYAYYAWTGTYQYHRWTDDGASTGPDIYYDRGTANPAALDLLAKFFFQGRSSAAAVVDYVGMGAQIVSPTAGAESGRWNWDTIVNGVKATRFRLGHGLYAASLTDPGQGKINAEGFQINSVAIGSNAFGNTTVSTSAPSGGADGDMHYQV